MSRTWKGTLPSYNELDHLRLAFERCTVKINRTPFVKEGWPKCTSQMTLTTYRSQNEADFTYASQTSVDPKPALNQQPASNKNEMMEFRLMFDEFGRFPTDV